MHAGTNKGLLSDVKQFTSKNRLFILCVSLAILIPCFWHKHIEAGDIGSHVYNVWLGQLVDRGQVAGLWIAPQWNNVAFDLLLGGFAKIFNWMWAEKLSVSVCVLIFFWGLFAFVSAAARRAPLFLAPVIAIITYGWTLQQGFLNYYLSLGLSFLALAILWRGAGKERLAALALVPLIFVAHPLGLLWFAGGGAYMLVAERFPRQRLFLFAGTTLLAIGVTFYVRHQFFIYRSHNPLYLYNGADQLVLYSRAYELIAVAAALFIVIALANEVRSRGKDPAFRETGSILLQLYIVLQCLVLVVPVGVVLPRYKAPITYLPHRLTTISAVLICALLGLIRPRRWHLFAYGAAAAMFFSLLYRDTGIVNDMEEQSDRLVANLPVGRRVLFTIADRGLRLNIGHFVDRSCVEHCFSYGNYEASTDQFRIRALPGNSVVMTQVPDVWRMELGTYEVTAKDLPADEIYQCGEKGRQLCIRALSAGEQNNPAVTIKESPFELVWHADVARVSASPPK